MDQDALSIKKEVQQWLDGLEDKETLNVLYQLKKSASTARYELSQEELRAVNEGIAELEKSRTLPHEQVMKEVREKYL